MVALIQNWFKRHLSDPEAVGLILLLTICVVSLMLIGGILTPVLTSVVIAYLLNGIVKGLDRCKIPHTLSTTIVCVIFVGALYVGILLLLPLLWDQLSRLIVELPKFISLSNDYIVKLHQRYPDYVSVDQFKHVLLSFRSELANLGQYALSISISSLSNLVTLVVYLVLAPMLVFFMIKDANIIIPWITQFMPQKRRLISQVWFEVNDQIGNFVRAKVLEIFVVSIVSILAFVLLGLNYSVLLGILVGLSVLIPFVGITIVTLPVIIVAYLQWGWTPDFVYLVIVYSIIAILDGNVLAPLLFSEAVKLHPVAVIVAILFFGGIWGFWGVFFAIPLATLVKAILNAF